MHIITVSGYDIVDTTTSTVAAFIGGVQQNVLSVDATTVVIEITDVATMNAQTTELFFEVGAPNGLPDIYYGVSLTPVFQGLSISEGSSFGSTFEAYISGVGVDDTVMLVNAANNAAICDEAVMVSYGVLQCKSKAMALSSITVAAQVNGVKYTCSSYNSNSCSYATFTTSQPSYASPALSGANDIVLTGTNLNMPGYTSCEMTHNNIVADSCTIDGSGNAVGSWSLGVPLARTPISPILIINVVNSPMASHQAAYTAADTVTTVFADPAGAQTDIDCAYAGGCMLTTNADGLAQNVLGGQQKLYVCGVEATLDAAQSGVASAVFEVPQI